MIRYYTTAGILMLLVAVSYAIEPAATPSLTLPCRVISIHDGDTCTVEVITRLNVRLLDCWAPEVTGDERPEGLKSKRRLEELAADKQGLLTIPLHDTVGKSFTFGRVLARLSVDGRDVSQAMVGEGFATAEEIR